MKQFKLIKRYPSLPQDCAIGMTVGLNDRGTFGPCTDDYKDYCIPYDEVSYSPEFWREIVELPIGTKVVDTESIYPLALVRGNVFEKTNEGWKPYNFPVDNLKGDLPESEIGMNKRFQVIEEPKVVSGRVALSCKLEEHYISKVGVVKYLIATSKSEGSQYYDCRVSFYYAGDMLELKFSTKSEVEITRIAKAMITSYFKK
jgi:hypothetical protein